MDKEMCDLYNSMTPEEKRKYQREMQKQFNETGKQVGNALKEEVHKSGIIGTIFKAAIAILLSGKQEDNTMGLKELLFGGYQDTVNDVVGNSYRVSVNSSLNYSTHSPRILKGVISMFQGSSLFQSSAV